MLRLRSTVVCTVLLLALGCDAWTCNVTLVGTTSRPQSLKFSKTAIQCTPGAKEQNQPLVAYLESSLNSSSVEATFRGKFSASFLWRLQRT